MRRIASQLGRLLLPLVLCVPVAIAQSEAWNLLINQPVERFLNAREADAFRLPLSSDQIVRVKIEQKGIDMVVKLVDPNNEEIFAVDGVSWPSDGSLLFITNVPGQYRLEIRSTDKNTESGKYEITLLESRMTNDSDREAAARFLGNLAKSFFNRDIQRTRKLALRSLDLAKNAAAKYVIASELGLIGNTFAVEGDTTTAIEYHNKALSIFRELNDPHAAFALNNLGIIYVKLDPERAIDSFQQASNIMIKAGDKATAAVITYNIGIVYRGRGDYGKAMTAFQQSSNLLKEAGGNGMREDLAINIAGAYKDEGNLDQAIMYYERALAGFESSSNSRGISETLDGLGGAYSRMGNYRKALAYFQRSMDVEEAMNAKAVPVEKLAQIGDTYAELGDYENADRSYLRALESTKNPAVTRISLAVSIARLRLLQGRTPEAIALAEQAKAAWEQLVGQGPNYKLYDTLAQVHLRAGNTDKAREYLERAIKEVESSRETLTQGDEDAVRFFANRISPYLSLTSLLHSKAEDDLAFEIAERAKSRIIVDSLTKAKVDISRTMTPDETARERKLKTELVSLNIQMSTASEQTPGSKDTLIKLQDSLRNKRLEFEDFRTRLYATHPGLAAKRGELNTVTVRESSPLLSGARSAVLEFVVSGKDTLLFVLTKDRNTAVTRLSVHSIHINQQDLAAKIENFRSQVASADLAFSPSARELYKLLLKPAAAELTGKTDVVIVPDGALWDLPFQALIDEEGRYLAQAAAVSYAPSLTALREMRRRSAFRKGEKTLVAFGNPLVKKETADAIKRVFMSESLESIPEAERLVNELAKLYGNSRSKVFTGREAREEIAKLEAPKFRIVQFATHGVLNNVSPMYSYLVMSRDETNANEDGLLEAWELKDLDLKADMVILSACDTARGKISSGEGIIGMTWAAFIAGAPTTVASQWKVESSSTTELMLEFHRQLLSGKVSKAEALRRAQLKLLRSTKYKHPSYWAPWVLMGDGS